MSLKSNQGDRDAVVGAAAGPKSKAGSGDKQFQISSPPISLPKGGGTIRGTGEKFATNPVIGTGSMSVPIATSPGRSGFGQQLPSPVTQVLATGCSVLAGH